MSELPCLVAPGIWLLPEQVEISHGRASGPGGQHVNKVSTAIELRFNMMTHPDLSDAMRARLATLAGTRLNREGEIIFFAQSYRSQERNRLDALERLVDLLRAAAHTPRKRRATRPTLGAKKRRLESKGKRGQTKSLRTRPSLD